MADSVYYSRSFGCVTIGRSVRPWNRVPWLRLPQSICVRTLRPIVTHSKDKMDSSLTAIESSPFGCLTSINAPPIRLATHVPGKFNSIFKNIFISSIRIDCFLWYQKINDRIRFSVSTRTNILFHQNVFIFHCSSINVFKAVNMRWMLIIVHQCKQTPTMATH